MTTRDKTITARILAALATIPDAVRLTKRQHERLAHVGKQACNMGASDLELREKLQAFVETIAPPSHAVPVYPPPQPPKPGDAARVARALRILGLPDPTGADDMRGILFSLAEVVAALWPAGDPDHEWSAADTLDAIAAACEAYRPKGRG